MPFEKYTLPVTPYDQATAFLSALMRGKVEAAGRAIVAPQTMSPDELQAALPKLISYKPEEGGVSRVMNLLTRVAGNPLFILGLLLASTAAPLTAKALTAIAPKYFRRISWLTRHIGPLESIFPPKVVKDIYGTSKAVDDFLYGVDKAGNPLPGKGWEIRHARIMGEWKKILGREPTPNEERVAGKIVAGGAEIQSSFTKAWNAITGQPFAKAGEPLLSPADTQAWLNKTPGGRYYVEAMQNLYRSAWDWIVTQPAPVRVALAKAMGHRGWSEFLASKEAFYLPYRIHTEDPTAAVLGQVFDPEAYDRQAEAQLTQGLFSKHMIRRGPRLLPTDESLRALVEEGVANPKLVRVGPEGKLVGPLPELIERERVDFASRLESYAVNAPTMGNKARAAEWRGLTGVYGIREYYQKNLKEFLEQLGMEASTQGSEGLARLRAESLRVSEAFSGGIGRYDTAVSTAATQYFRSLAPQYAFTMEGYGPRLWGYLKGAEPSLKPLLREHIYTLMGRRTYDELMRSLAWHKTKLDYLQTLKAVDKAGNPAHWWVGLIKKTSPKMYNFLVDSFQDPKASMTPGGIASRIATYFYLSTMGFNPGPVLKNFLQPFITAMPLVGVKPTTQALIRIAPKYMKFLGMRAGGVPMEEALRQVFPGFASTRLAATPLTDEMLSGTLAAPASTARPVLLGEKTGAFVSRFKKEALRFFGESEMWNRVFTYEVGEVLGEAGGLSAAGIHETASQLVRLTQFPGGFLGLPPGIRKWPHPLRQFLHFPLRFAGMLLHSTKLGTEATADYTARMLPFGRNLGTIGRGLMYSTVMYEAARAAGVDLSPGLMFGALPLPQYPGSSFFPLPVVPPILSVMGNLGIAAVTGNTANLGATAALLVPGGVMGRRLYKTLAPRYAAYGQRQPDGSIPTFSDTGGFVGSYSPMQLFLRSVGLPSTDQRTEQFMVDYLRRQRDQIREYRRQYVEAISTNEIERANKIQAEFQSRYPDLGPINVKSTDITALEERKTISRIGRVLQGLPKEYRPQFASMVQMALSNSIVGRLERAPGSLEHLAAYRGGAGQIAAIAPPALAQSASMFQPLVR